MNNAEDDEYEVVIIRYGTRETLRSKVFLNYEVYGESDGPIRMDYYFWVIRNAHRTFVVDTGYSEAGGRNRGRHHLIAPADALSLLGVDPDHATVIVTHAHYDHAGNIDLFPHSAVIIPATEYEFWNGPYAQRQQYHHAVEDRDIAHLRRAHSEGRLRLHEGTSSLAPGIEMIELGGHSPGQCVLTVKTTDGLVLLASDATHFYEQIERDMPFHIAADLKAMYAGFDRMKELVRDSQAILIPGHDPAVLGRYRLYEGDLSGIAASIGQVSVSSPVHDQASHGGSTLCADP